MKSTNPPDEPEELQRFNFYPNPAREIIHLNQIFSTIRVYDMNGQLVISRTGQDYLDISNLTGGIYIIEATEGEKVFRSKLIHP